ncbi:MAG: NADH-quinone oxidoreductase subunit NuoF [Firmicutes bacterium]|nr:NADH-quinone oxidoreductase subunit NuoF [Bacillota bacterium]MDD4263085.1 NADH-quinone oxidoreductase subunit NuoF [Bacillota bacterium]MDD4694589.1 NADH-quinone oxidoreductase subunit NuoF [Bacillota bacterium]
MEFYRAHVLVCGGSPCVTLGCKAVREEIERLVKEKRLEREICIIETGCLGACEEGPIVVVYPDGTVYSKVNIDAAREIVNEHLVRGRPVKRLQYKGKLTSVSRTENKSKDYFQTQKRVVLENVGLINPNNIDDYILKDGYKILEETLDHLSPEEVVNTIKRSGLRGRGGAGFPTGTKLGVTARTTADQKYIVCNADEGEPGTYKDRIIMEGDPHKILEGMALCGYAVGATKGYVYIRGEYYQSIATIRTAIEQARELGLLGTNLFDSGFDFDVEIKEGAGSYVCGEETALIQSMEGKRGEATQKPPYPSTSGLWGKPTVVINVETVANIVPILKHGVDWYKSLGTPSSSGTKIFTLSGNVNNRGLIEVPMGIPLREIIYGIGGGISGGRSFKMAQIGGTAGGCLSEAQLDTPLDYENLQTVGSSLGSGAILVVDDSHCIVDVACSMLNFFAHESCGQCTPCREGTSRLLQTFRKLSEFTATKEDLDLAIKLARVMQRTSLCASGQSPIMPLEGIMQNFASEIEAHLNQECPAGVCHKSAHKTLGKEAVING